MAAVSASDGTDALAARAESGRFPPTRAGSGWSFGHLQFVMVGTIANASVAAGSNSSRTGEGYAVHNGGSGQKQDQDSQSADEREPDAPQGGRVLLGRTGNARSADTGSEVRDQERRHRAANLCPATTINQGSTVNRTDHTRHAENCQEFAMGKMCGILAVDADFRSLDTVPALTSNRAPTTESER